MLPPLRGSNGGNILPRSNRRPRQRPFFFGHRGRRRRLAVPCAPVCLVSAKDEHRQLAVGEHFLRFAAQQQSCQAAPSV